MTAKYETMFAVPPLGIFKYPGDMEAVIDYASQLAYKDTGFNQQSENSYVLHDEQLKDLKEFCLQSVHQYQLDVLHTDQSLDIQQSWINFCPSGGKHPSHYHANSFLSGVLFLNSAQENNSPLCFQSPIAQNNYSIEVHPNKTDLTNLLVPSSIDVYSYQSEPKTLLIFSSLINHFVPTNQSHVHRISLAFNTFPTLPFGSKTRLTSVDAST